MRPGVRVLQPSIEYVKKLMCSYITNKFNLVHHTEMNTYFVLMSTPDNSKKYFLPIRKALPVLDAELNPVPILRPVVANTTENGTFEPHVERNKDNNWGSFCTNDHLNYRNLVCVLRPGCDPVIFQRLKPFVTAVPQLFSPVLLKDWECEAKPSSTVDETPKSAATTENAASLD